MKGPQTSRKGRLWPFSFLTGWTYGRLYSNRVLASVGACCLLILTAMTPTLALASQCADYDKAMAACVAAMADLQDNPNVSGPHCVAVNGSIHIAYTDTRDGGPGQMGDYQFICPPGLCTCGPTTRQISMAQYGPITGGGPHMADGICDVVFTSGGALLGTFRGVSQCTGHYTWEVGTGSPPPDAPPPDAPCNPSDLFCFNPGNGTVCGNIGGTKVCTDPGTNAPPPNAGSCTSAGGTSYICGGAPDAPRPIDPQGNPVPPTAQNGNQNPQIVPPGGQPPYTINITTYNTNPLTNTGGTGGNGGTGTGSVPPSKVQDGKSDQNGHCPDGSTPSAGGCGAGYTDNGCDVPPMCTGDPLLCGQLRETHRAACEERKFRADNGVDFQQSDIEKELAQWAPVSLDAEGSDAWMNRLPDGCVKGADGSVQCTPGGASTDPVEQNIPRLQWSRFWGGRQSCPGLPEYKVGALGGKVDEGLCTTTSYLGDLILALAFIRAAVLMQRGLSNWS